MPATSRPAPASSASCPAASSVSRSTRPARPRTGSPCRRASSTSAARRRPRNICTAQVLLAVIASMYAVYHGPDGLRAIARRVHRLASILAAGLRGGGEDVADGPFFDTVTASRPRPARAPSRPPPGQPGSTCASSTPTRSRSRATRRPRREHVEAVWHAFGVSAQVADARRGRRRSGVTARDRLPHPPGLHRTPLRDGDAALPAAPGRPRLRARPRHDPARLVHDEAQRDHRDGAGDQPGLRATSTRSPRPTSSTGTGSCSPTCRPGWPRSPATTRCRCSPTPARRASSPGCSRSTTTTWRPAASTATCA